VIISKTPYRVSFFGGGSDYPQWHNEYKGSVLSTTIDKHIYLTCRNLPNFFDHKFRFAWSKLETVKTINQIQHKAVRCLLNELKIKNGLEIHYDGDLPARSGMGSSSSFTVGLIKTLFKMKNIEKSKADLTKYTINFEQNILQEVVGSQDQTAAVYGGFNRIDFKKKKITVKPIRNKKNLIKLNKNLVLIYTGVKRDAPEIAKKYVNTLTKNNKKKIEHIVKQVDVAEKILNNGDVDDFGRMLNEAWIYKKELNNNISNNKIDHLYDLAINGGALGGKLLGAGGGGFLLMYMKEKNRINFFKKNKKLVHVQFNFSSEGSKIIFIDKK
jgi:D-glycero-alpha-D-manno-heptose-7-phosphate kinase